MSWSGFKKAASRAGTQVMMKTGHVEKTSDREYEVEERRFRTLESASLRLQKEAKGYLDSLRAMTASQMRIAETIDAFYGDSGAKDGVSRSYKQAVEDLDAETVKALDGPYRCVPQDLYSYALDEERGLVDQAVIDEIERELNFQGKRRTFTDVGGGGSGRAGEGGGSEGANRLMDFIYRTTVLEPISRFCAYFPDINECIKKRNHKMLDYDAVRAKVRKLTEKPDKDPSKLPRTEKEAEMVSVNDFLHEFSGDSHIPDPDLTVPSPPKALDNIKRVQQLQHEDYESIRYHSGLSGMRRSGSVMSRMPGLRKSPRMSGDGDEMLGRSPSLMSQASTMPGTSTTSAMPLVRESSTEALLPPTAHRTPTFPVDSAFSSSPLTPPLGAHKHHGAFTSSPSLASSIAANILKSGPRKRTPFFHPSDLEQIMQPLREEYIRGQTNEVKQARAAYEQLNDQLSSELPQLIDLRVPYLDPSFEALVKIQLRFCAEAYSRMAQVQQYLDPGTRDQYASGDLDARVEDVLGQIRELSIAGTV